MGMNLGSSSGGDDGEVSMSVLGWVLLFLAYVVGAYVTIFFQSALVMAANDRMTGGNPTLGSAKTDLFYERKKYGFKKR